MFYVEQNVPDIYIQESRDFQLFSRLYDLVFQASRFSIDSLEQVSDTMRCNDRILSLIATKVGFFTNLNLTDITFRKILSAFPYIIKYKGSLKGIKLVANLFERITNTSVTIDNNADRISVIFENSTENVQLLYHLMEYIRPTGTFVDYIVRSKTEYASDYVTSDKVNVRRIKMFDSNDDFSAGVISSSVVKEKEQVLDKNWDVTSNVGFANILKTGTGDNDDK